MSWSEISPGKWQRPIGENETFIKLLGDSGHAIDREHWAINSIVSSAPVGALTVNDLPALFLQAWKELRFDHPSIAAYVADDKTLAYEVPDATALNRWAAETFKVVADVSADEVIAAAKPEPYATLTYLTMTGELLGRTAHWRTDGIGVLMLFDALLALATAAPSSLPDPSTLPWGQETTRLAPPVEEAANIPAVPSDSDKSLGRKCVETFYAVAGAVGISYHGDTETVPSGTRSAHLRFTEEQTTAVVGKCKSRGISVTAAVHASVAAANYAMAVSSNRGKHYTSTVRFSFRPYLPAPYSGPEYASGLYTTGWMKAVPAEASWSNRASAYQEEYHKGLSAEYVSAHREYALGLGNLIRNMPQGGEPPSDVDISSIGVAENLVAREKGTAERGIRVDGISVGVEILTRQCVCFLWTFRDQLNFNLVYNESFHDKAEMEEFTGLVKNVLLKELGV